MRTLPFLLKRQGHVVMVSFNRFVIWFLYLVLGLISISPVFAQIPEGAYLAKCQSTDAVAQQKSDFITAGYAMEIVAAGMNSWPCPSTLWRFYIPPRIFGVTETIQVFDDQLPRCRDGEIIYTYNDKRYCMSSCASLEGITALPESDYKWCTSTDWNYCDDSARMSCIQGCEAMFFGDCPSGIREDANQGMNEYYCHGLYRYTGAECRADPDKDPGTPNPDPDDPDPDGGDPDPGDPGTDPGDGKDGDGDPGGGSPGGGSPGGGGPGGDGGGGDPGGSGGGDPGTIDPGDGGDTGDPNNGGNNPGGSNPDPGGNGNGGNGGGNGGNGTGTGDGGNGNGDGDGDGEGEETDPYCKQYPNDPRCKTGQFSGNCDLNFTCQGDPIFCANAKAVNQLNCQYVQKPIPQEVQREIDEGLAFFNDLQNEEYEVDWFNLLTLEREYGSCPSPEFVHVMGQSFTLDYYQLCEWANIIGFIIMFAAAVVSVRILAA